ncbi:hypothetical protein CS542_02440 [Pedobacter sp. IW39]|nr:hypothetical protein CS542_02440 [Pedobacter sp. IW39]
MTVIQYTFNKSYKCLTAALPLILSKLVAFYAQSIRPEKPHYGIFSAKPRKPEHIALSFSGRWFRAASYSLGCLSYGDCLYRW